MYLACVERFKADLSEDFVTEELPAIRKAFLGKPKAKYIPIHVHGLESCSFKFPG